MAIRSEITGRLYNEVINKTILMRDRMNRFADGIVMKATVKREDAWEELLNKK